MAKPLSDILKGVKTSKIEPGSTGKRPGVDYAPKSKGDQDFVAKHKTEKHADRVGNEDDVYKGTTKYVLDKASENKHGYDEDESEKVYEAAMSKDDMIAYHKGRHERIVKDLMNNPKAKGLTHAAGVEHQARTALKKLGVTVQKPKHPSVFENTKCNMTEAGKYCPVHENASCMEQKTLKEKGVKESLVAPLLGSNDDESAEMAKTQLRALANKALALAMFLSDDQVVEPWVQAKIAVAKDNVTAVHDYMVYGNHDKPEKEQTAPMDTPMTFPNMNVDVNTGVNV